MSLRIPRSRTTVKDLSSRLQSAYQRDEVRLVRRTTVLLDLLVHRVPVAVLGERWGLRPSCLYDGQKALLLHGLDSVISHHGGGRQPTLPPRQQKRVVELMEAGPPVMGCATACWDAVLLRVLSWRECGVLYDRHDVCTLLHNLGFSFHKARCVSDHRDAAKRLAWLAEQWPAMFRAAKRCKGLIVCEEEASVAPWGSLSYPWARRGRQPEVPTCGTRTGSKVCGTMESCSGRLCYQGLASRLNSESDQGFWHMILEQTTAPLFLLHDGARYHTSQATQQFVQRHRARITVHPLPSSSPDDTLIDYLWKNTKKRATHNQYFQEFAALTVSVEKALAYCATHPETVSGLFGLYCQESGLELKQAA